MDGLWWAAKPLKSFQTKKVDWLWKPFIPYGTITTLAGEGEAGKSTVLYLLVGGITTGRRMPQIGDDKQAPTDQGSVILLTKEDEPGFLKPRLQAAGADLSKVHMVVAGKRRVRDRDEDDVVIDRLDDTLQSVADVIARVGDVRAVIIDPITDFAGQLNLYREDQVRKLLTPLSQLAAKYDFALINVLHLIKDARKPPRQRILGSVGLVNISRSVLMVGKVEQRRYLMMEKANWWPEKRAVAFAVKSYNGQPVAEFEAEYAEVDINEVMSGRCMHVTKQQLACLELRKLLMDGPMQTTVIELQAEQMGISWNTFKAAKKELAITSIRLDGVWWWQLPKGTSQ